MGADWRICIDAQCCSQQDSSLADVFKHPTTGGGGGNAHISMAADRCGNTEHAKEKECTAGDGPQSNLAPADARRSHDSGE